jgi:hypothetical protein
LFTSAAATNWQSAGPLRTNESNTRPARFPHPITAMRILLLEPCQPKTGLTADAAKAAAEVFKNVRLVFINRSPWRNRPESILD